MNIFDVMSFFFFPIGIFFVWRAGRRWLAVLAAAIFALYAWAALTMPAAAHQARSGWQYPRECCSGHADCHWVEPETVVKGETGYYATVAEGAHPHGTIAQTYYFPFLVNGRPNDTIKQSGDTDWHLCLGVVNIQRCIYVPPGIG